MGTNERELTTGLLAKDASFRLIVSGRIGAKEIDMLIAKLQLDRDILAAQHLIKQLMLKRCALDDDVHDHEATFWVGRFCFVLSRASAQRAA